jgi:hypothetical protein
MNDRERELWVLNDERLYNEWRASKMGMQRFIRRYRAELDAYIAGQRIGTARIWRDSLIRDKAKEANS